MRSNLSRRKLLKGSAGLVTAGALVSVAVEQTPAAGALAIARDSYVGSVASQLDQVVHVSILTGQPAQRAVAVPVEDFPTGWVFRPGDLVLVTQDSLGRPLAARPLVRRVVGTADAYTERAGSRLVTVAGTDMVVQAATVMPEESASAAVSRHDGRRFLAHYVDNDIDGLRSCFGFRPLA
jgi:hypothetical protein